MSVPQSCRVRYRHTHRACPVATALDVCRSRRLGNATDGGGTKPDPVQWRVYTPGGYSTRTPSLRQLRDRRPSVSGGCGRPTTSTPSRSGSSWSPPRSASDQALARQSLARGARNLSVSGRSPRATRVGLRLGRRAVGWAAASRPGVGDQGCTRGLVRPFGMVTPVLGRPPPPPVWHGMRCSCGICSITCRSPGMPTSSIIMPLIQAIPPGGRKRTGWPPQTRRCAKSWQNWIPGSRPCKRNRGPQITCHPVRHAPLL